MFLKVPGSESFTKPVRQFSVALVIGEQIKVEMHESAISADPKLWPMQYQVDERATLDFLNVSDGCRDYHTTLPTESIIYLKKLSNFIKFFILANIGQLGIFLAKPPSFCSFVRWTHCTSKLQARNQISNALQSKLSFTDLSLRVNGFIYWQNWTIFRHSRVMSGGRQMTEKFDEIDTSTKFDTCCSQI